MTITRNDAAIPESAIYMASLEIADFNYRPAPNTRDKELARRVVGAITGSLGSSPLEPTPRAFRNDDPPTTVAAAVEGLGRFSNQRSRMLLVFATDEVKELKGLNADQAGDLAQLSHGCYWKRFSELRHLGLIEDTGETRKGRSGQPQRVCRLSIWGEVAVAAIRAAA